MSNLSIQYVCTVYTPATSRYWFGGHICVVGVFSPSYVEFLSFFLQNFHVFWFFYFIKIRSLLMNVLILVIINN